MFGEELLEFIRMYNIEISITSSPLHDAFIFNVLNCGTKERVQFSCISIPTDQQLIDKIKYLFDFAF